MKSLFPTAFILLYVTLEKPRSLARRLRLMESGFPASAPLPRGIVFIRSCSCNRRSQSSLRYHAWLLTIRYMKSLWFLNWSRNFLFAWKKKVHYYAQKGQYWTPLWSSWIQLIYSYSAFFNSTVILSFSSWLTFPSVT